VIVGVESTDSRNYGEKHGTLHLTDGETVKREKREEYKLDESHRWERRELETLDDGVYVGPEVKWKPAFGTAETFQP